MAVEPFSVEVPDSVLDDLRHRLRNVRLPADFANGDWRYGVPRGYLDELIEYWRTGYDWRVHERAINAYSNFRATIDDVPIHFIHERGVGPAPVPLILTHGWPWTFWDFEKTIRPLTDPAAFGGDPGDAFDVVVPSLPGFGFSTPLTKPGVSMQATAELWLKLMREELGYDRFGAQGGDWGHWISAQLGHKYPQHLIGVHLNIAVPLEYMTAGIAAEADYATDEKEYFAHTQRQMAHATSHVVVQGSEPQTLAYGLHDSPSGLLAWLVDRRKWWSDCHGDIESVFSKDDLLTLATIYWVTESFATSARYYWESQHDLWAPEHDRRPVVEAPTGIAVFPGELIIQPREWMRSYYNLQHLTYMKSGGHFAPAEQPEALVEDIRDFFRPLRSGTRR
jgi:pimeloyl-ACP methyl ester carboxylesterase